MCTDPNGPESDSMQVAGSEGVSGVALVTLKEALTEPPTPQEMFASGKISLCTCSRKMSNFSLIFHRQILFLLPTLRLFPLPAPTHSLPL